jgi:integrase/recombinase XerD
MLTVKPLAGTLGQVATGQRAPYTDLVDAWLDDLSSSHTKDAYGRDLAAFVTWCDTHGHELLGVGLAELIDYRDDCDEEGVRPGTVARRLSALASFFQHALAAQAVSSNPLDHVRRPGGGNTGQPSGLDEHDALALLDAAAVVGPKVVVLVALLMLEGMKLAEALALDVDQLDGSGWSMRATVQRRGQAQGLALDGRTARAIAAYLDGRTSGPMVVGESPTRDPSRRLTRFGADFLLKRAASRAGLEPVSANTLRRTYMSLSHRDGASLEDISRRVGHATARDTRRYLA